VSYSDQLGEQIVTCTVDELSHRIGAGICLWMIHGRGAEGMTMPEIIAGLKRHVPIRWLAVFIHDADYAKDVLAAADALDYDPTTVIDDEAVDPDERFQFPTD
jgi:hypothetical protein